MARSLTSKRGAVLRALVVLVLAWPAGAAQAADAGALRQLAIGTHVDLSGPLASWGHAVRNGLQMAFDEANAGGGVNGHAVRLVVRDDSYDPGRAAEAVREMIRYQRIFAVLAPLGTPTAHLAAREAQEGDVLYLFPLAAGPLAPEPPPRFFFTLGPAFGETTAQGLRRLVAAHEVSRVGVLASDDAFGQAILEAVEAELARLGLPPAAAVHFARGASDLGVPLDWLRAEGVQLLVLATVAEEALEVMRAAATLRWSPRVLCSAACHTPELAILGGAMVEGLYAMADLPIPYPDDPQLLTWARRYEQRFSAVPTVQALTAYRNARLFLAALARSGRIPTPESFAHALETLGAWVDPEVGGAPVAFSPGERASHPSAFLAQVRGGRWAVLPDASAQ